MINFSSLFLFSSTFLFGDLLQKFSYLPLKGPVKLANPDITLQYFEYYGTNPNEVPENPIHVFFGKLVGIFIFYFHFLKIDCIIVLF